MKLSIRHLGALCGLLLLQCGNSAFAFTLVLPEMFVPSTEITEEATLNSQAQPLTSALSGHFRSIFRNHAAPKGGGAAASDESGFQGAWVNSSNTEFENTFSRFAFDGSSQLVLLGFDFALAENHLLGLAVGTESTDIDTTFNSGNQETSGTTLIPYYGWLISDNYSLDISMGGSDLDTDQYRVVPFIVAPGPGLLDVPPPITSSASGERNFKAINFNAFYTHDRWNLGARVGYVTITSEQGAFTESDGTNVAGGSLDLKQTFVGGDIAYSFGSSGPFLSAVMQKDSTDTEVVAEPIPGVEEPSDDDDSLLLGAGWRYYGEDGLSAILEWNTRDGKDDYSEDSVSFTLRKDFN